jgi:hypothetical protein
LAAGSTSMVVVIVCGVEITKYGFFVNKGEELDFTRTLSFPHRSFC